MNFKRICGNIYQSECAVYDVKDSKFICKYFVKYKLDNSWINKLSYSLVSESWKELNPFIIDSVHISYKYRDCAKYDTISSIYVSLDEFKNFLRLKKLKTVIDEKME